MVNAAVLSAAGASNCDGALENGVTKHGYTPDGGIDRSTPAPPYTHSTSSAWVPPRQRCSCCCSRWRPRTRSYTRSTVARARCSTCGSTWWQTLGGMRNDLQKLRFLFSPCLPPSAAVSAEALLPCSSASRKLSMYPLAGSHSCWCTVQCVSNCCTGGDCLVRCCYRYTMVRLVMVCAANF